MLEGSEAITPSRVSFGQHRLTMMVDKLSWGGVQRVLFKLAQEFIGRDIQVDFAVCEPGGRLADRIPPGVRVIQLDRSLNITTRWSALCADAQAWKTMLRPVLLARKLPAYMVYLRSFAHYLKTEQPSVVLSAGRTLNITAVWARILAQTQSRIVLSEHVMSSAKLAKSRKWGKQYLPPLMARNYAMGDSIVAVSNGVADDLASITGLPRQSIHTIYNPIVNESLLREGNHSIDHSWFQSGEPPVILGAGRLVKEKDFPTLVKAFGLVRRQRDARLVILGAAKDETTTNARREELLAIAGEMGVANDVYLPGYVDNAPSFMAKSALFVLSSINEGFGNVLVEALALGCPVVSTDCPGGPSEILEDGKWGPLVPVGDYIAMAKAMLHTLDNPIDREKLLQRGLYYSTARATDSYARILFPKSYD